MDLDFSFFGFSPKPKPLQGNNHLETKGTKTTKLNMKTKSGKINPELIQSAVELGLNSNSIVSENKFCSEVVSKMCTKKNVQCRQDKENNSPNSSFYTNNSFHEDEEVIPTATLSRNNHKSLLEATGFELNLPSKATYSPHSSNPNTIANLAYRKSISDAFDSIISKSSDDSVIVISDSGSVSSYKYTSINNRRVTDQKRKLKKGIATRRRVNVPSVGSSSSGSRVIRKSYHLKTIILESSDDDDHDDDGVLVSLNKPEKILAEEGLDSFKGAQLTESKQRDIEMWLQGNVNSDTDNNLSSNNLSLEKMSTPQMDAKSKEKRRNDVKSAKKVLDELYGKAWRATPNVLKHYSSVSESETESEDGFDELLKKYKFRKSIDREKIQTDTLGSDFIDNESISAESEGFYQSLSVPVPKSKVTEMENDVTFFKVDTLYSTCTSVNKLNAEVQDKPTCTPENKHNEEEQVKPKLYTSRKPVRPKKVMDTSKSPFKNTTTPLAESADTKRGSSKIPESKPQFSYRSFMESLSDSTPSLWCDPEAQAFKNDFGKTKNALYSKLFKIFNSTIFENKLPKDTKLEWNTRLKNTAGFCYNSRIPDPSALDKKIRSSRIELSTNVCDTPERLRDTLVHELCHAANWIINGIATGHGKWWKAWAARARYFFPELPEINRCHNYAIQTKYTYECQLCGYCLGRHSKSLDIVKKRCGYCYGVFKLHINYKGNTDGNEVQVKGFALYVKENYTSVKSTKLDLKHGDIMKLLGQQFSAAKVS